jgi:hypothetical protein
VGIPDPKRCRLPPPSSGMIHAVASGVYREVTAGDNVCCSASYQGAFERLEPDDGKLSSPVLRGRGGSNASLLPDRPRHSTDKWSNIINADKGSAESAYMRRYSYETFSSPLITHH